eukprot:scaffold17205_cov186-Amphora_coffeaeformis.AAC.15
MLWHSIRYARITELLRDIPASQNTKTDSPRTKYECINRVAPVVKRGLMVVWHTGGTLDHGRDTECLKLGKRGCCGTTGS